jgi:hypothetical protein
MLNALPDRPLYDHEIDALIESDTVRFAFPPVPQSLRYDETSTRRIYDLFLFLDDAVVAVAYVEQQAGWIVIAKEQGEQPLTRRLMRLSTIAGMWIQTKISYARS